MDQVRGSRLHKKTRGGVLKAKPEPLFEPDRSEDASGIVLKASRMQHAERARTKIGFPSIGIEHTTELLRIESYR